MVKTKQLNKLEKLIAHEKSCRAIGSIAEADAFLAKINQLRKENKYKPDKASGILIKKFIRKKYFCTCGAIISIELEESIVASVIENSLIRKHQAAGHKLLDITNANAHTLINYTESIINKGVEYKPKKP